MIRSLFTLFPYPYIIDGQPKGGLFLSWPAEAERSLKDMLKDREQRKFKTSSSGFDYFRIDESCICTGILLREIAVQTQARSKLVKKYRERLLPQKTVESVINAFIAQERLIEEETNQLKDAAIDKYVHDAQYKSDFLKRIKPEIEKGLSFVHDYKQINAQIAQNINFIIESNYQGANLDEKLEKATVQEKAIYYSSRMLSDKLLVSRLLLNQDWLNKRESCKPFRFHGMLLKYIKIYESEFHRKYIRIERIDESQREIVANPDAVAVVVHTFIDNSIKYAPKGSSVIVESQDQEKGILYSVSSYGPIVDEDEIERIFEAFYRGRNARKQEDEGAGYGLYVAQMIAIRHLGTRIVVAQDLKKKQDKSVWTVFSILLPYRAEILE